MFYCKSCGRESPVWKRFCPECNAEKTLEKKPLAFDSKNKEKITRPDLIHLPSGFPIFDSIFAGGFLRGFLYFLHAESGAGKTTFLLKVCSYLVSLGLKVLYFSFDEGINGMKKKCQQYLLTKNMPIFIFENNLQVVTGALHEYQPDLVVLDSLQRFAKYDDKNVVSALENLQKKTQRNHFAFIVVGEEQREGNDYLGSAHIGHIVDVQIQLVKEINDEVVISTPKKNRDTDDRSSRCFFRRTPTGLIEIKEEETGYLSRHNEREIVGLATFVAKKGNDFFVDEITAAIIDRNAKKASLIIAGMNNIKAKNLLAVIDKIFELSKVEIVLRSNSIEKLGIDSELACVMAVLSILLRQPIPVHTAFIGSVDNTCHLLPVMGMEQRVKRAKGLGYKRIIGSKAIGSQTAVWEEFDTLESLKREFFR